MEVLRIIRSMLNSPKMGSRWEREDWVFLSGRELGEKLNCNRKTADAELAWLTENGFLVREKLGGKALKPTGTRVALGNRSWFYRLGEAVKKYLPWWVGQSIDRKVPSPRPVTGQSITVHTSNKNFLRREQAQKQEQPAAQQPLTGKDELKQAREVGCAVLQAPAQATDLPETDSQRTAREHEIFRKRKEAEERAKGFCPPSADLQRPTAPAAKPRSGIGFRTR